MHACECTQPAEKLCSTCCTYTHTQAMSAHTHTLSLFSIPHASGGELCSFTRAHTKAHPYTCLQVGQYQQTPHSRTQTHLQPRCALCGWVSVPAGLPKAMLCPNLAHTHLSAGRWAVPAGAPQPQQRQPSRGALCGGPCEADAVTWYAAATGHRSHLLLQVMGPVPTCLYIVSTPVA